MDGNNSPGAQATLAAIMLLFCTVAIGARIEARRIRKQKWGWDDYTIIAAWVFTLAQAVGMWIGVAHNILGSHPPIDPVTELPFLTQQIAIFYKILYAAMLTGSGAVAFNKISVLLMYNRLFPRRARDCFTSIALWMTFVLVIIWSIAFELTIIFNCWPIEFNWHDFGGDGYHCITNMWLAIQAWTDVGLDGIVAYTQWVYILTELPKIQKIAVTAIFMLGALTLAASITKLVVYYKILNLLVTSKPDITYYETPLIYWPMIESSLGITAACLPLLRPIFTEYIAGTKALAYISNLQRPRNKREQSTENFADAGVVDGMAKDKTGVIIIHEHEV